MVEILTVYIRCLLRSFSWKCYALLLLGIGGTWLSAIAQHDTIKRFYRVDDKVIIKQFEREHLPLDGHTAAMIPYRVDELYGFVRPGKPDKWLIKPQFEQVYAVHGNRAIVKDTEQEYGLIDQKGNYLIAPYWENLLYENGSYHGVQRVSRDSTFNVPYPYDRHLLNAYFDGDGQLLFSEPAHQQQSFVGNDSLAWFRFGRTFTVRSKSGKLIKKIPHNEEKLFNGISSNLLVYSQFEDTTHYFTAYDAQDQLIFKLPVDYYRAAGVHQLSENLYGIIGQEADYYFCDSSGQRKPFGNYSYAVGLFLPDLTFFDQEFFSLTHRETELMGVVNRQGQVLVDFKYRYIGQFVEGLAFFITEDHKEGFMDAAGNEVLQLDRSMPHEWYNYSLRTLSTPVQFKEDWCVSQAYTLLQGDTTAGEPATYITEDSTYFFYFDHKGETTLKMGSNLLFAGYFAEGLAPAVNAERALGFINTKGEWAIAPAYELVMAGDYPFPYLVVPAFKGGYAYIKSFKGYIDQNGTPYFSGKRMQDHYDFSH